MKVKVKDPNRVYFDREQQKTFIGKKVILTRATATVRQLLNEGHLIELAEPEPEPEQKKETAKSETTKSETTKSETKVKA